MSALVLGLLLMVAAILWLCWQVLFRSKDGYTTFNIFHLAIAFAAWLIGRVTAGKGILEILFS